MCIVNRYSTTCGIGVVSFVVVMSDGLPGDMEFHMTTVSRRHKTKRAAGTYQAEVEVSCARASVATAKTVSVAGVR